VFYYVALCVGFVSDKLSLSRIFEWEVVRWAVCVCVCVCVCVVLCCESVVVHQNLASLLVSGSF
jgi:hypothetical protein